MLSKIEVINFFSDNYKCRSCFHNPKIKLNHQQFNPANVEGPQPRWIGKNYFESDKKICFMLINPGSGNNTPNKEWEPLKNLYKEKKEIERLNIWDQIMKVNKSSMPKWGKWKSLYLDQFGFDSEEELNKICFTNMMLCSAWVRKNNKFVNAYNSKSLDNCFNNCSNNLLKILSPKHIIFSGVQTINSALNHNQWISLSKLRSFSGPNSREINSSKIKKKIRDCLDPDVKFFYIGHYGMTTTHNDYLDADIIKKQIYS